MRLRRRDPDTEVAQRITRLLEGAASTPGGVRQVGVGRDDSWVHHRPVEPRPELDRLHGWVPEPPAPVKGRRFAPVGSGPKRDGATGAEPAGREPDELDRFLASHGLDGMQDIDDWNVDGPDDAEAGWWARLSIPWRAAVALTVVVALGAAGLAVRTATADRPGSVTAVPSRNGTTAPAAAGGPVSPSGAAAATLGGSGGPTASATGSPGSASANPAGRSGVVFVHVVGEVKQPGVVRLAATSRVAEAVAAAGGLTARADVAGVNLARQVTDGEQIRVPRPGESVAPVPGTAASAAGTSGSGTVNLNTATAAELEALDGVGAVLAQRIVEYRTAQGQFRTVEELGDVTGIGDKLMERLRPQVTV